MRCTKAKCAVVMFVILVCAVAFTFTQMQPAPSASVKVLAAQEVQPITQQIPPLPAGVTDLKFSEFFVSPIGDRGLAFTEKLRSLDGKRVRVLGYMARQEQPVPGMFLFSAIPVRLNEEHYGLADDLPAATVFVSMPRNRDQVVPHAPGLMFLTGTLSVGNREEADGRISAVRLAVEVPPSSKRSEQLARRGK